MPLSYKQLGNTFIQGQNIIIYPSGNSYVISKPDTESFGFTSVGIAGFDFFPPGAIYVYPIDILQDLTGPNATMIYKSFSAGTGIGIINSNNTLIFTATTPTINGLTSFTSAGTGNRLLLSTAITSNTLFYKSITGTSNLDVNDNNGTLTFSLAGGGSGTIISGTNVGTGINVFTGLSTTTNANDTLAFRNISGGPNINIALSTANDGDILISRGSPTLVNQISPNGTIAQPSGVGARVLSAITTTTNLLIARTISGANGFTLSNPASPTIALVAPTNTTASRLYISNATSQLTTDANFGADATSGSLSIGSAVSTTSRLLIAAGTASISQLRLTAFSGTVTSPTDGDIWYTTSGNTLKFYKNNISTDFLFKDNNISLTGASAILSVNTGGTIIPNYINSFGVFSSLSSLTLTNRTTETSIISPVLTGSTTLLASTNQYTPELLAGRKYRFNAKGTLTTTNAATSINSILSIKLGSTIISLTPTFSLLNTLSSVYFEIDTTFTIRSTGAAGNVVGSGKIISNEPLSTLKPIQPIYQSATTINTTSDQIFDCTATFSITGVTLTVNESSLEFLT